MVATDAAPASDVRAEIYYVRNPPPTGAEALTFVTETEDRSTMRTRPGRMMTIHDLRGVETDLDREGFVLVQHTSSVSDFDAIEEDAAVDRQYVVEMTGLLSSVTGADQVIMLGGGKKRYGESATDKLANLKNAKPARYPHGDVTDVSGPVQAAGLAAMVPGLDLTKFGRWALFNMWRSTSQPPQDHPLAVCDARSVEAADGVPVIAVTEIRGFGSLDFETTGYLFNSAHRWCWFRDMTPQEVLIFKTHDSDPSRAHRVPHTAFTHPDCPPGTPTRSSVEMRALAVFR
ncbi:MAG: CmcJ/NvfI family oxidoreductase [Actinomycetota bacterium]|nr:CmcJ/NvfI family oxidoreductase [Actinomycetota bacterium]